MTYKENKRQNLYKITLTNAEANALADYDFFTYGLLRTEAESIDTWAQGYSAFWNLKDSLKKAMKG